MDNNNNTGILLQRRRKSVKISKEETLLILPAYISHPTSWSEILNEVKQNMNVLSPAAREVYTNGSLRQLRDRMSGKLNVLMKKTPPDIPEAGIWDAIEEIKRHERRLIPRRDQRPEQQALDQAEAVPAQPARPVVREKMAAALSTDSSEEEQPPNEQQDARGRRRQRRKRPLAELIRENQEGYNKFITKKVPKLMTMIGVSSSSDENQ